MINHADKEMHLAWLLGETRWMALEARTAQNAQDKAIWTDRTIRSFKVASDYAKEHGLELNI